MKYFLQIIIIVLGLGLTAFSFMINPIRLKPKTMAKIAILIGVGVVLGLNGFKISLPLLGPNSFEIKFDTIPIFMVGFWFGPSWGVISGLLVDLLQLLFSPVANPYFGFTLNLMLTGFLAGLIYQQKWNFKLLNYVLISLLCAFSLWIAIGNSKYWGFVVLSLVMLVMLIVFKDKVDHKIGFVVALCEVLIQMFMTSFWLVDMFQLDFNLLMIPRIIEAPLMIGLNTFICMGLNKILNEN